MTMEDLGVEYDVHPTSILGCLRRNDEKSRKTKENQYDLDEHFFDCIDTEEKAYFFGILYADGNTNRDAPKIVLSLQEDDRYLVEKLNSLVSKDRPVRKRGPSGYGSDKEQFQLEMYSQHMKDVLVGYGMVPAKSLVKVFPPVIMSASEDIQRHFIRGYFDGNGSVGIYKRKGRVNGFTTPVTIVSTKEMCEGIQTVISKHLLVNSYIHQQSGVEVNTWRLTIQGSEDVKDLLKWMYKDATILMKRKQQKANKIIKGSYKNE